LPAKRRERARRRTLISGTALYYRISYNHRFVYVNAADVDLS
jgi:hypothetical protein